MKPVPGLFAAAFAVLLFASPASAVPDFTFTSPDLPLPAQPGSGLTGNIWHDNGNAGSLAGVDTLASARNVTQSFFPDAIFRSSQVDYPVGSADTVGVPGTDFDTLLGADAATLDPASVASEEIINSVIRFVGLYRVDEQNETHDFSLGSDDGSELVIQGTQVIDNDGIHAFPGAGAGPKEVLFTEPGLYAMEILFFESQQVRYGIEFADGGAIVPQSRLYRSPIPVPASLGLLGIGLLGLGVALRRARR